MSNISCEEPAAGSFTLPGSKPKEHDQRQTVATRYPSKHQLLFQQQIRVYGAIRPCTESQIAWSGQYNMHGNVTLMLKKGEEPF
jgi:hypothetical protein